LVAGNAGQGLHALVPEGDIARKESEPCGGHGAEDDLRSTLALKIQWW
jgi:hypothetical protein